MFTFFIILTYIVLFFPHLQLAISLETSDIDTNQDYHDNDGDKYILAHEPNHNEFDINKEEELVKLSLDQVSVHHFLESVDLHLHNYK